VARGYGAQSFLLPFAAHSDLEQGKEITVDNIIEQINQIVVGYVPHLIGALAILVPGWLVARVLAAIVRGAVRRKPDCWLWRRVFPSSYLLVPWRSDRWGWR
jgi:Mechanosensitive ion channel, conserved TM helix